MPKKTTTTTSRSKLYIVLTLCFFISGASALFFQVLWIRLFSLIFGTTQFAMGTVIAGFLGGLGIGSWLISRSTSKIERPLLVYGILELFIGLYGLAFPWICQFLITLQQVFFSVIEPNFFTLNLFRLFFALIFLLPPTTAMGATLPILSQLCQQYFDRPIQRISFLYAINTLGASLGAFLSGLFLIPTLGLVQSNWVAVGSNFLILLITFFLARLAPEAPIALPSSELTPISQKTEFPLYLKSTIFISSIMTLILELVWSRVLEMILGATVYVVSSILTAFILGLGLGSFFCSFFLVHRAKPFLWIGLAFILSSLSLLGSLYLMDELPIWMILLFYTPLDQIAIFLLPLTQFSIPMVLWGITIVSLFSLFAFLLYLNFREVSFFYFLAGSLILGGLLFWAICTGSSAIYQARHSKIGNHFEFFFLVKFLMVCGTILPPAIFLGMIFPLGISAVEQTHSLRQQVGKLYFVSTLGCIVGSLAGGFFLIPWIGVKNIFFILILLGLCFGFFHLFREHFRFAGYVCVGLLISMGSFFYFTPLPFQEYRIASGVLQYIHLLGSFTKQTLIDDFENARPTYISHRDGVTATITMKEEEENFALKVNGKVDASSQGDMYTQVLSAQIPMLLTPSQKNILVVGYGSGVTVSSVLTHTEIESVTLVEIEKEVLNASRYFQAVHAEDPLQHPKVHLEVDDARNYLLLSKKTFDVIISEPSNPWMAGASKLFTLEFYQTAKKRLTPDGMMANWIQLYGMDQDSFFILFNTIQSVFPYVYLFQINRDLLLVGRNQPLLVSMKTLQQRFSASVQRDLGRLKIWTLADVFGYFSSMPEGFRQLIPSGYQVLNTDNLPLIEYQAPKNIFYKDEHKVVEKWLNSSSGEVLFPRFILWNTPEEEQSFQEELFHTYLLKNDDYRAKECILWNLSIPERELWGKRLEWKLDLFQNAYEPALQKYQKLSVPFANSSLENDIFYQALLQQNMPSMLLFVKGLRQNGLWVQNPEFQKGWRQFFQLQYGDCLKTFESLDPKRIDIPLEYFLLQGICLEKTGQYTLAESSYQLFFQKLMNQILKENQILHYLYYVHQNTDLPNIKNEILQLKKDLNSFFQILDKTKFSRREMYIEKLKKLQPFLEKRPQSYLFFYHYSQIFIELSSKKNLEFLEQRVSLIKDCRIFKSIAFRYKMKGILENNPDAFKKAIQAYHEAERLTSDPWEIKDIQLRIQLIQEKL